MLFFFLFKSLFLLTPSFILFLILFLISSFRMDFKLYYRNQNFLLPYWKKIMKKVWGPTSQSEPAPTSVPTHPLTGWIDAHHDSSCGWTLPTSVASTGWMSSMTPVVDEPHPTTVASTGWIPVMTQLWMNLTPPVHHPLDGWMDGCLDACYELLQLSCGWNPPTIHWMDARYNSVGGWTSTDL